MKKSKQIYGGLIIGILALFIFIIIILFMNYITKKVDNNNYNMLVEIFNQNLENLIIFFILIIFAEGFRILRFPLNLPYPLLNAISVFFINKFFASIARFINESKSLGINDAINKVEFYLTWIFFGLILVFGYYFIIFKQKNIVKI